MTFRVTGLMRPLQPLERRGRALVRGGGLANSRNVNWEKIGRRHHLPPPGELLRL